MRMFTGTVFDNSLKIAIITIGDNTIIAAVLPPWQQALPDKKYQQGYK